MLHTVSGEAWTSSEAVVAPLLMIIFLTIFVLVVPVTSVSPSLPVMVIHPEMDGWGSEGAFRNSMTVKPLCPLIPHPLLTRNVKHVNSCSHDIVYGVLAFKHDTDPTSWVTAEAYGNTCATAASAYQWMRRGKVNKKKIPNCPSASDCGSIWLNQMKWFQKTQRYAPNHTHMHWVLSNLNKCV